MLSMGSLAGAQCSGQVGFAGRSSRHSGTSSVPCRAGGRARPDTARAVQRDGMWDGRYQELPPDSWLWWDTKVGALASVGDPAQQHHMP